MCHLGHIHQPGLHLAEILAEAKYGKILVAVPLSVGNQPSRMVMKQPKSWSFPGLPNKNQARMKQHRKGTTFSDRDQSVGTVSLAIRGFSDQARVDVEQIVIWVEAAPAFHLVGLSAIIYDPQHLLDMATADSVVPVHATHKAQYVKAEQHILVHDFDDAEELQHILYHELGHHVWVGS